MTRQSKGKTSSGTREDNALAVKALVKYLQKILDSPQNYIDDDDLIKQLKNQNGLTTLKTKEFVMDKMVLGTLKKRASDPRDSVIIGGWDTLNKLRLCVLDALSIKQNEARRPSRQTKIGIELISIEQQSEISKLSDDVAYITFVFYEILSLAKETAKKLADPSDEAKFVKQLNEIMAKFSHFDRLKTSEKQ